MEETQARILDTAAQLFADNGYSGVSMRDIGRAVGITQAAIYHHFSNKQAVYIACVAYVFDQNTLGLREQMDDSPDPVASVALVIENVLRSLDQDPRFLRLFTRELLEADEARLSVLAAHAFRDFHDPIHALMERLAPGKDAQLLLFSLAGMIFHHLEVRKLSPYMPGGPDRPSSIEVVATHITDVFLHGVQAQ